MHVSSEIESLRAQLAEVSAQRNASNRKIEELTDQLLANQAHATRLVEALTGAVAALEWRWLAVANRASPVHETEIEAAYKSAKTTLSTPINLDALHEAMARECERMAHLFPRGSMPAYNMFEEAAAHRAKKEGK